jgi:hypothetical protein
VAVLAHVTREGGQAGESAKFDTYLPIIQQSWAGIK